MNDKDPKPPPKEGTLQEIQERIDRILDKATAANGFFANLPRAALIRAIRDPASTGNMRSIFTCLATVIDALGAIQEAIKASPEESGTPSRVSPLLGKTEELIGHVEQLHEMVKNAIGTEDRGKGRNGKLNGGAGIG